MFSQRKTLGLLHAVMRLAISIAAGIVLIVTVPGCGKKPETPPHPAALPVNVIEVQPTSVPISAEAVAQTEGAKEVEIRPRVGGILLKRLYEEGAAVKAGQSLFLIDPVPYRYALAQAKAQLAEQKARVIQTERDLKRPRNANCLPNPAHRFD